MPVSHGPCTHSRDGSYESSAWFVRNDRSLREFLFFGDVEPDSLSINARTRHVWKAAAPKIAQGTLSTIFLECSWRSTRAAKELYGHLSPPYVIEELRSLAMEVVNLRKPPKVRPNKFNFLSLFSSAFGPAPLVLPSEDLVGALKGVKLVIIHCKTSTESFPDGQTIEDIILSEVQALAVKERLGVSISVVKQGDKLGEPTRYIHLDSFTQCAIVMQNYEHPLFSMADFPFLIIFRSLRSLMYHNSHVFIYVSAVCFSYLPHFVHHRCSRIANNLSKTHPR